MLENVSKRFGDKLVIDDMNLAVRKGRRLILLGSSGCSKSTVLRMIAGLETVTSGTLRLNGEVANDMDAGDRGVAMVFQNYALFPHMTVEDNISYGLRIPQIAEGRDRPPRAGSDGALTNWTVWPSGCPGNCRAVSGSVSLCRALVNQADFFFLDEPLSNLDAQLRAHARRNWSRFMSCTGRPCSMSRMTRSSSDGQAAHCRLDGGKVQMLDTPQRVAYSRQRICSWRPSSARRQ